MPTAGRRRQGIEEARCRPRDAAVDRDAAAAPTLRADDCHHRRGPFAAPAERHAIAEYSAQMRLADGR